MTTDAGGTPDVCLPREAHSPFCRNLRPEFWQTPRFRTNLRKQSESKQGIPRTEEHAKRHHGGNRGNPAPGGGSGLMANCHDSRNKPPVWKTCTARVGTMTCCLGCTTGQPRGTAADKCPRVRGPHHECCLQFCVVGSGARFSWARRGALPWPLWSSGPGEAVARSSLPLPAVYTSTAENVTWRTENTASFPRFSFLLLLAGPGRRPLWEAPERWRLRALLRSPGRPRPRRLKPDFPHKPQLGPGGSFPAVAGAQR